MKNSLSLLLFLSITATSTTLFAQKNAEIPIDLFKSSTIPDSLKQNSNSVIRYSLTSIVVKSPGEAVKTAHKLVTILNEKAGDEALMILPYDKFSTINSAEMRVYNSEGELIKKYKKGDMYDGSLTGGSTIVSDDRFKGLKHTIASYPVTVETITEETESGFLDLDSWVIQDEEQAVQRAVFTITGSAENPLFYKARNISLQPSKYSENNKDTFTWKVGGLKAVKSEEGTPSWLVLPRISFSVSIFKYDGHEGRMDTWKNFGLWINELNADVNTLSAERSEQIKQLVAHIKEDKDKAKFLYEYLQKEMRYVSIQLGIGGFKPFSATFVDQKKYGDCKALANYMHALLKAVNIPSYYAIIRAGDNEEPADPEFVASSFNHAILCIPLKGDTTWIDCTSNTNPFGKLGTFTENRNALLITEEGGRLANTPVSKMQDNVFESESVITLNEDGSAKATLSLKTTGGYRDMLLGNAYRKLDDQKKFLINYLRLKQPDVFEMSQGNDKDGKKESSFNFDYARFNDMAAGNKLFLRPRLLDIWTSTLPAKSTRKYDYYFDHPMLKKNTTVIELPKGFEIESLPANTDIKFSYGNFKTTYTYKKENNQLTCYSEFQITNHVIPAEKYAEMQEFMENVSKSLNKKLVINKKI
ncbi:DUF3857 domain-containing protein [Rubrolithibacter danxiaensis]|uniref:DUF3857 domain-containing protein n=1 Tax=Rubrolithibacter danxiaensis TaxID=3390805 RepID=UPI003BF8418E